MIKTAHTIRWWWRLQFLQWMQTGRTRPVRRTAALLAWWLSCVIVPLALHLSGISAAATGLDYLLSLDVPLTLALAAVTAVDALRIESRTTSEDWLGPRAFRPMRLRWISRLRWLLAARWPVGLALAAMLLTSGAAGRPEPLVELMMMVSIGIVGGATSAWAMRRRSSPSQTLPTRHRRARGLAALSWVALHEARERFDSRRATLLAVPALLAAPLGAMAGDVARMLALWLALMFIATICREAAQAQGTLHRWLRTTASTQLRLAFWIWRYVMLGIAATAALCLLWTGSSMHATGRQR